jgi:1-acyl-sn-glycerol-3-phosphate acyltransferase
MESDRFVLRSITDEIMYELMELSGQEYVDMYAAKAKSEIDAAKKAGGGVVPGPGSGAGSGSQGSEASAGADASSHHRAAS